MFINGFSQNTLPAKAKLNNASVSGLRLKPQLFKDVVSFSSGSHLTLLDILNNLDKIEKKDWKKFRKGDTNLTIARMYNHPDFGKVKIGMTLAYREESNKRLDIINSPKAFIEIPKKKICESTSSETARLFTLAKNIIGDQAYSQLKEKGERSEELTQKRYTRLIEDCFRGEKKRKPRKQLV